MTEQSPSRPQRPAPSLDSYPHRATDIIRFADLDPQGHVNNAVFSTYFETGRVAMFRDRDLGIGVPDATFVLVRAEIDYLSELRWPGNVEIGTALASFGRTSFVVLQAIFHEGVCAASARVTMVMSNKSTRRPVPLTDAVKERLGRWAYRGAV